MNQISLGLLLNSTGLILQLSGCFSDFSALLNVFLHFSVIYLLFLLLVFYVLWYLSAFSCTFHTCVSQSHHIVSFPCVRVYVQM